LKEALIFAEPGRRKKLCFYLGVCYSRDGNGKAAEERLIESLPVDRRDPFWAQAQYQLGCLYFQRSAYLKAKTAFEMCACFLDDDDDMKEEVLDWLSQTRVKLGQSG
jgi:hypothetical protein